MTKAEFEEIAKVLTTADGSCHVCAENLAKEMQEKFPEFDWVAEVKRIMG